MIFERLHRIMENYLHVQERGNHSKQSSLGDEDEAALLNIKPMEPLLRGYKRGIIFPRRISSTAYIG